MRCKFITNSTETSEWEKLDSMTQKYFVSRNVACVAGPLLLFGEIFSFPIFPLLVFLLRPATQASRNGVRNNCRGIGPRPLDRMRGQAGLRTIWRIQFLMYCEVVMTEWCWTFRLEIMGKSYPAEDGEGANYSPVRTRRSSSRKVSIRKVLQGLKYSLLSVFGWTFGLALAV